MDEVKTVKVKLGGREFEVKPGYPMRTLRAESEAGKYPVPLDIKHPTQMEVTAHALWAEKLVGSYFALLPEFMADCQADEVMNAAAEIQKAKLLDPFGNPLPTTAEPVATESTAPTTGS